MYEDLMYKDSTGSVRGDGAVKGPLDLAAEFNLSYFCFILFNAL